MYSLSIIDVRFYHFDDEKMSRESVNHILIRLERMQRLFSHQCELPLLFFLILRLKEVGDTTAELHILQL